MVNKFLRTIALAGSIGFSACIGLVPSAAAFVIVDIAGTTGQFNPGPFAKNVPFTGRLTLDDTVIPTGAVNTFANVITSFSFTVQEPGGPVNFTGSGGRINQFSNAAGTTDFISVGLGSFHGGSINGTFNAFTPVSFGMDLRGPALFTDPTVLATGLSSPDFSYAGLSFRFTGGTVIENSLIRRGYAVSFSQGPTSIDAPSPFMIELMALLSMALIGRRRRRV